jgi:hypothetical protein
MKIFTMLVSGFMAATIGFTAPAVQAEEVKPLSLETLIGKYEGRMQLHATRQKEFDYQVEIATTDKSPEIFSLESTCSDCETKVWKRNNCQITDAAAGKFTCKGKSFEEEFTFKEGGLLRGSGHTSKWLYSISVTKVAK